MDQDKIRTRWFEYISVLYKDDSRGQLSHIKPDTADIIIIIVLFKVQYPISSVDYHKRYTYIIIVIQYNLIYIMRCDNNLSL